MLKHSEKFGERVRTELQKRGLSQRGQRVRTGIDHVTISDMQKGLIPRLEVVEAFARGLGIDVNEFRQLAGYERVGPGYDAPTFEHQLCDELAAHYQEPAFEVTHLRNGSDLAPDTLRAVVIRRVELIERRLRERFREQGRELPLPLFVTEE